MGSSMHSKVSPSSVLRQCGRGALIWAWAGAALAHAGHDHDSWMADWLHLFGGMAPLLLLLAAGVASALAITSRNSDPP